MKRFALISLMILSLGLVFAVNLPCYDVQYTEVPGADGTYPSLYNGQTVTVTGVVTEESFGTSSGGPDPKFMIGDLSGGPWSGLYIYRFGSGVARGDMVSVTGPVSEYAGLTEIGGSSATVTIVSHNNALPAASVVPTVTCTYPGNAAVAEQWENVLCKFVNVTVETVPEGTHRYFDVNDGSGAGEINGLGYQWSSAWTGPTVTVGQVFGSITGILESYKAATSTTISYSFNPRDNNDFVATSNEDVVELPEAELIGNYPNPVMNSTTIAFNLKSTQAVKVQIFNLKGQKVRTLVDGKYNAQLHNVTFDGKDDNGSKLTSGLYMYKLTAGNSVQTRKLVIK